MPFLRFTRIIFGICGNERVESATILRSCEQEPPADSEAMPTVVKGKSTGRL